MTLPAPTAGSDVAAGTGTELVSQRGGLSHVNLHLVDNTDTLFEFKQWLGERRPALGIDTETSGLSHERDRIRLCQFGDLNDGWAFPWKRWSGAALEAIQAYDGPTVFHNSKFDVRFIAEDGGFDWQWHRTEDTMAMAHILDPLRPKGLKALGAMYVDPRAAASQRMLHDAMSANKWTWESVPDDFPYYWMYGALDPVITCHLREKFRPEIAANYEDVFQLEMDTTRIIAAMERRGARVDLAYSETMQRKLVNYVMQARDWLREQWGLESTSDLRLLKFFNDNRIDFPVKWTKGGRRSLDKEVMQGIDHVVAKTILQIRRAEKTVGPYFRNFIELADADSRLHCNVWTMGTRTARMSITDPALQTLPRKDPTVRTAFIPSDGHALITCDYDQIEARLMAHFSEDPGLIAAFWAEDDFFSTLASQVFGRPIHKKRDSEDRQVVKNSFYGKLYGASAETMAATAGVPLAQMAPVVAALDRNFPGIIATQRRINATARMRQHAEGTAYINTPTGRRMVSDDNKEYTLTNYLIQCHAAEILKQQMRVLDALGLCDYLILPVHDELVFDVPLDIVDDAQHQIGEAMSDLTTYRVPITASAEVLRGNWGDKYREERRLEVVA